MRFMSHSKEWLVLVFVLDLADRAAGERDHDAHPQIIALDVDNVLRQSSGVGIGLHREPII